MEYIRLVPSDIKDSILKSNRKDCVNGIIELELRVTDYSMVVSDTTAVSIDLSLLSSDVQNSYMEFNLTVFSAGNNVLNLSGFNVQQVQVLNGETFFTIRKNIGEAKWVIQMKSSETRPEMWLRCYENPFVPQFNTGVYNFFNLRYLNTDKMSGIFSDFAPGQTGSYARYGFFSPVGDGGYICAKFPMPVWLKSVCIAVANNNPNISEFPTSLQVYGTNDGVSWTQLLTTSLTPSNGSVDTYMCTTTNYYTLFKFKFTFSYSVSAWCFPSIALSGFCSELINTGAYSMATPYCTALPTNGYNIEANSSDMSSTEGDLFRVTQFEGGYYRMVRSNTNTPWEFIYTFPEAIRTIGLIYKVRDYYSIKLFSLSYSDNKTDWTEYCKVDGSMEAWNQNFRDLQIGTYFCDSCSEHRYYKITIYSNYENSYNEQRLGGIGFLQFQKGHYFTFESFIPKLNSNIQNGYILISSNSSEGDAYKLFDHSISSYGGGNISDGQWTLNIMLPQDTVVRGLELVSPPSEWNRMPYEFSIQGSTDSSTWTTLKSFSLGSNYWTNASQVGQWEIENETAYKYYQLVVTATSQGSVVRIGEMGLSSYASFKSVDWYEDEYLVPVMDSNSQDGYVASASSVYNAYHPYKAFNREVSDSSSWETNEQPAWIQIELPTAKIANILQISGTFSGEEVRSFILKASNDGSDWTTLLTVSDLTWTHNETKTWELSGITAYKYYLLDNMMNSNDRFVGLSEFTLINRTTHESN